MKTHILSLAVLVLIFSQAQAICFFLTNRGSKRPRKIRHGRGRNSFRDPAVPKLKFLFAELKRFVSVFISEICGYHSSLSRPNLNTIAKRFLNFVPLCLCNFAPLQPYNSNNSRPSWFKETAKKRKTPLTGQKSMIPKKQKNQNKAILK
jgi:hypothetical protein